VILCPTDSGPITAIRRFRFVASGPCVVFSPLPNVGLLFLTTLHDFQRCYSAIVAPHICTLSFIPEGRLGPLVLAVKSWSLDSLVLPVLLPLLDLTHSKEAVLSGIPASTDFSIHFSAIVHMQNYLLVPVVSNTVTPLSCIAVLHGFRWVCRLQQIRVTGVDPAPEFFVGSGPLLLKCLVRLVAFTESQTTQTRLAYFVRSVPSGLPLIK